MSQEVLIKVVLQALPVYLMSVFLLPKALCNELACLLAKFWWGFKENEMRSNGLVGEKWDPTKVMVEWALGIWSVLTRHY